MIELPDADDLAAIAPRLLAELERIDREEEASACEANLFVYLQRAWRHFDPSRFTGGWHLEAIAEHLEAVSNGQIRRLLINIPPRFGKTNLVAVAWPTWTWARSTDPELPLVGPGVRFLCASYGANKAQGDGVTARRLIGSDWYQARWGERVTIAKDRDNQEQYDTTAGGSRISTGIPESLGKGGAIRIIDDPHKTDEVESDVVRGAVIRAYDEIWRTRANDPANGAEVIIMQRQAENDLSGHVLADGDWVHLCLPLEYEPVRHCATVIGFEDPRTADDDLLWPERFDHGWVARQKTRVGDYAYAGQYQQAPQPRGGGIIKREWWQVWPPEAEEDAWTRHVTLDDGREVTRLAFPDWDYMLVVVDGAYTTKEENDWCACVALGVFRDRAKRPRVMLAEAWRERVELRGLVTRTTETCRRRNADALLIEAKGPGISAAQEVRRLMADGEWTIVLDNPEGDKAARLISTQPMFQDAMVFAPDRKWADAVIAEVAAFPRAPHDDWTDCVSAGLRWLRKMGLLRLSDEHAADERDAMMFHGNRAGVTQEYGV